MMTRKHRLRAARNLIAAGVLLVFFWWCCGCPLPDQEMEFHRREREHLIDPSTVVLTTERKSEGRMGDHTILVGVSKYTVQTSYRTSLFNVWPKNPDGTTLVVLPTYLQSRPMMTVGLVAVEPPARAAQAKLTVDMTAYEQGAVYTAEGERDGVVFLFRLEETPEREQILDGLLNTTGLPPYTLEFFDKAGTLLDTVTNIDDLGEQP